MQFHEGIGQRQTQPRAFIIPGHDAFHLNEGLEHLVQIFPGNPDARIRYPEYHPFVFTQIGGNADPAPFRREFDGVPRQIENDLFDAGGISQKRGQAVLGFNG